MGGGIYCSIVGCFVNTAKCKGVSFHKLPKQGTGNDEWRRKLIHKINRVDAGFNPDKAVICSRHFLPGCITAHALSGKRPRLRPGSLPTEFMPKKSVETPKLPERKQPTPREPPPLVQRVYYYNLPDVKKDARKLPSPWLILEDTDDCLVVGTLGNGMIAKQLTISSDLSASVRVYGMPVSHLNTNLENVSLKTYASRLDELYTCPGVTDLQLQEFAFIPTSTEKGTSTYFLHASYSFTENEPSCVTCVRSKQCLVLSTAPICPKCLNTKTSLLKKQQEDENDMIHLKPNDPLHTASRSKLKKALKRLRKMEKKQRRELEECKQLLSENIVVQLNGEQDDDAQAPTVTKLTEDTIS